jgi:hypothetical protein
MVHDHSDRFSCGTRYRPVIGSHEVRGQGRSAWPHLDVGAEPGRRATGHIRALRRGRSAARSGKPKLFSRQRRRAVVEVTFNGPSAACCHRFELHYRRSQDPTVFGASHHADRQLPPERRRSHLVSHLTPDPEVEIKNVKLSLAWSPVTESNRRPSPYHGVPIGSPARRFSERPG